VRTPYDWAALVAFLAPRAIPGMDVVRPDRVARGIVVAGRPGTLTVSPAAGVLEVALRGAEMESGLPQRVAAMFGVDVDPAPVMAHLRRDPLLAPLVDARPGLRVPGAWDGFELAARAVLGQQVSVAGATTLAGRMVIAYGARLPRPEAGLTHLFPTPERIAAAEDLGTVLGIPRSRAACLRGLAAAALATTDLFAPGRGLEPAVARLCALPGVGPWTAHYIAMRALREADAFPAADIGVLRALATAEGRPTAAMALARAEVWRPYRAYAVMQLWMAQPL
jgi:DNA-3-methyladenine glycosylase II